ncbi:protein E22 [Proboscivirus elephantidbeta4]|uniref:Protein E22 n=1 Tax=Elephant endotheliotropic herpesvirus 4 TaxID=548914 RepID=A0A0S1TQ98_9BETA|nr:protein E22 [Elephant endotheliotropic herpesvirus 4]ALM25958.1 protein E22 [Elephant endotheliotropic herpesvirus 4]
MASSILKNVMMTVAGLFIFPFWIMFFYVAFVIPYVYFYVCHKFFQRNSVWVDRQLKGTLRRGCLMLNFIKRFLCALVTFMDDYNAESPYDV